MEIIECTHNIKCELGACGNRAAHTVKFDRIGLRGRLHACEKCLNSLYAAIGEIVVPKSVETARKKPKKDDCR